MGGITHRSKNSTVSPKKPTPIRVVTHESYNFGLNNLQADERSRNYLSLLVWLVGQSPPEVGLQQSIKLRRYLQEPSKLLLFQTHHFSFNYPRLMSLPLPPGRNVSAKRNLRNMGAEQLRM